MGALNAKQLRFVELYQKSLAAGKPNATQAYLDAGYKCSAASARAAAARLLADVSVQHLLQPAQQAVEVARQQTLTSIEITRDRIRLELARLSFVNPKNLFHPDGRRKALHELDDDTAAAVAQFEVEEEVDGDTATVLRTTKVKFWDKNRALQSLGDTEPGVWVDPKGAGAVGGATNVNVSVNAAVFTLTAADLDAAEQLAPLAGGDLHPHGGPEPVHPAVAARAAAPVPPAG